MSFPLITIITVSYNSANTISDTINSVLSQTYPGIEYIIIDGSSSDGTVDLVKSFGKKISKFVSEPDNGMYDAINKGIKLSGGDIIGILNSDDYFYDDYVIERIAEVINETGADAVYGDVLFIDPLIKSRIARYYSSKHFKTSRFRFGFMPAHPGFYVKREFFEKLGYYKTDYKIAADFELMLRFLLLNNIRCSYIEMPLVVMRPGGLSNKSFRSNIILNREIARACRENGVNTNYLFIYSKYFLKIFELFGNKRLRKTKKFTEIYA
ncbi:MAG: glycosyltransferase family 2 protein [Bacteroidota bacterium]